MSDDGNHLTNEAFGKLLGLSHATISRIRGGTRMPSGEIMLKIATLMDWPVEEQMRAKLVATEDSPTYAEAFRAHEHFAEAKVAAVEHAGDSTVRDE